MSEHPIIPCRLLPEWRLVIDDYAAALKEAAPSIGSHGLDTETFHQSGLFRSAIEKIRGEQAATTKSKYAFIEAALEELKTSKKIKDFTYAGNSERHDYEVILDNEKVCCIEAKGCLDGNNTNIFERPPNADEFVIWSLCQNPGANPRHNAWSGIHTRLSAEIISRQQRVDGLIIWDMLCGTVARPCPKLLEAEGRRNEFGAWKPPPPCIYLFPRTVPNARNNPNPQVWQLHEVRFLSILADHFKAQASEIVRVNIQAQMNGSDIQRRTIFKNGAVTLAESQWASIRRAR